MQINKQITLFINNDGYGSFIVDSLAKSGYQIRIATSILEPVSRLKVLGYVGQIEIIKIKLDSENDIQEALKDSFLAINCTDVSSLNNKSITKVYQTLPLLIAKNSTNFIHFSSMISNSDCNDSIVKEQRIGNEQILLTNKKTLILKIPFFTIGNAKIFENIGNIAKNLGMLILPKYYPEKEIYLLNGSDIGHILIDVIKNKPFGQFDVFSKKIKIADFLNIIIRSCSLRNKNIIQLPSLLSSLFIFLCKFQRIIDVVNIEKMKIAFNNEVEKNKLNFIAKSEDLESLIAANFEQFDIKSELSENKKFATDDYYPNS